MKKILNIFILLLSFIGCSNNTSINSSTYSYECFPFDQNEIMTFEKIKNITVENILFIEGGYYYSSFKTKIKEEDFDKFYSFINRQYNRVNNQYLYDEFNLCYETSFAWEIAVNNKYIGNTAPVYQVYDDDKNSYFIIPGAKESYLSIPITPEEMKEFPSY